MVWDKIKNMSFKFFGRTLEPYVKYFEGLKPDLQKANLSLSLTEYVYIMIFTLLLVFVAEFPLIVVITSLIFGIAPLAFVFSTTITIFIMLGVFFIFYTYPSYTSNSRRKKIDSALPFVATYMSTVASSGAPPQTMFKVLARFKEYGEISREAEKINRDVEAFGMDIVSAMRKTASRTPSPDFKELLWGMDTVISSGGNLGDYLHEKSRLFMQENRRKLEQFSQTLSMLIEIYLTIILVGSIFFIIMTALMSMFGGGESSLFISFLQFLVIFIIMPFVSVGFIFMLKSISPISG